MRTRTSLSLWNALVIVGSCRCRLLPRSSPTPASCTTLGAAATGQRPVCGELGDRPSEPCSRRHRGRRGRGLLGGLSPHEARLERRAAAGAGAALLGHDLARRRAGRTAEGERAGHPAVAYSAELYAG